MTLGVVAAGLLALALGVTVAREGEESVRSMPLRPGDAGSVVLAAHQTFKLMNPFPFPLQIRILGDGPGFPQVKVMPAAPGAPVPIPYPTHQMKVQFKKPTGGWSKIFNLKWKSGTITLPFL